MYAWNTGRSGVLIYLEDDFRERILKALEGKDEMLRYMLTLNSEFGNRKPFNGISARIDRKLKKATFKAPQGILL